MLNSMYYKETFLIAITLIIIASTTASTLSNDYHSNEEVTSTGGLDFFDAAGAAAENNNDFYDQRKESPFRNIFNNINARGQHVMTESAELSTASVSSTSGSPSSSDSIASNNILTTMVPPAMDPVQQMLTIFSTQQPIDDEDGFNYTTTSSIINEISAQDHYGFSNVSVDSEYADEQDDVIFATTTTASSAMTRMKQGKQIPISNLQPHEALLKFVEDSYIRRPLAILIDTAVDDLEEIKRLWLDALRPNAPLDCVLLAYNASGVPVTYNFTNTRTLLAGINSIIASESSRGNGFFGIIRAIELIPYDSAVFVSTGQLPADENLAQYAATALLKKRIRLYLTWLGEKPLTENETHQEAGGTLGSVAVRSGGEVIFAGDTRSGDYPTDNMVTIFSDHLQGTQDQELTVETTVSDLYIKVDTSLKGATLETPHGEIDLLKKLPTKKLNVDDDDNDATFDLSKVIRVSDNALIDSKQREKFAHMTTSRQNPKFNGKQHEIMRASVRLTKQLSHPARFYLKLEPDDPKIKYRVTVQVLNGYRQVVANDPNESVELIATEDLALSPHLNSVRDDSVDFEKEYSAVHDARNLHQLTHESMRFPDDNDEDDDKYIDDPDKTALMTPISDVIEVDKIINNKNNNSTIISRQEQQGTGLQNAGTVIEMGIQSQLLLAPGSTGQLHFEITNYRSEPILHSFRVIGEQRFLVSLNMQNLYFAPGQTAVAIVTVSVPATASIGIKDQITFTCLGTAQVSKMATLKVAQTSSNQDSTQPSLRWDFGSRCDGNKLESGVCADNIWSVDVIAHDWGTGLLRVQSNPRGLLTRSSYTSGTTTPVTAVYTASCCQPKVTISAYDLNGNVRTITIDVRDVYLTEAAIAAIVVGAILLLVLIIGLILLIVWCCKRHQETLVLPSYRSHRRTSAT